MKPITDLRFVVVSGKGGVGRTTVAATLARVAAATGKRVLVATAAATDRVGRLFGRDEPLGPSIVTLAPESTASTSRPSSSLIEYGVKVLRSEMVSRALFENRAVRGLLGADPRASTPTRCSARPGGTRPRCATDARATTWSCSTGPRAATPR